MEAKKTNFFLEEILFPSASHSRPAVPTRFYTEGVQNQERGSGRMVQGAEHKLMARHESLSNFGKKNLHRYKDPDVLDILYRRHLEKAANTYARHCIHIWIHFNSNHQPILVKGPWKCRIWSKMVTKRSDFFHQSINFTHKKINQHVRVPDTMHRLFATAFRLVQLACSGIKGSRITLGP